MHLGTRSLTLTVDGIPRTADVSDCKIVSGPHPFLPRLINRPEPREYRLQCVAAQDLTAESLWDLAWSRHGEQIEVDLRPAGGSAPSETQPWFTGTVTIAEPDGDFLGGQANASLSSRFTFEIDWAFESKPTRVDI